MGLTNCSKEFYRTDRTTKCCSNILITKISSFKTYITTNFISTGTHCLSDYSRVSTTYVCTITTSFNTNFCQCFWNSRYITTRIDHISYLCAIKSISNFFCTTSTDVEFTICYSNACLHIKHACYTAGSSVLNFFCINTAHRVCCTKLNQSLFTNNGYGISFNRR